MPPSTQLRRASRPHADQGLQYTKRRQTNKGWKPLDLDHFQQVIEGAIGAENNEATQSPGQPVTSDQVQKVLESRVEAVEGASSSQRERQIRNEEDSDGI